MIDNYFFINKIEYRKGTYCDWCKEKKVSFYRIQYTSNSIDGLNELNQNLADINHHNGSWSEVALR